MSNIDQWKQANETLRDIEKELLWARNEGDEKHELWMLKEKKETNALIIKLEKETKGETER
tara:strand:- start:80 stop:262 length:183 start_codon:yes stop_codon:yes gene_type:complete